MTDPLVWLPFDAALLGRPPDGLRYETVLPSTSDVPPSADEVEFYVPAYNLGASQGRLLSMLPRLRVVQTLTAGVEHLRPSVPEGVLLCNGRGIHDASTAELAVALSLASLRGIPAFLDAQRDARWSQDWHESLADKTVLVLGFGAIGAAIEARLRPFEVEVVKVARTARDGVHAIEELPALLPDADVVILILPVTNETRGLVDVEFLGAMKPGALLVNVARGSIVVTDDLVAALSAGKVRAALDVTDPEPLPPDHPLWHLPGVIVTPHVGGATPAMWPRAYRLVRDQLERFAAGRPLANVMTDDY